MELVSTKPKVDHKGVKKKQQIMFQKPAPIVIRNIFKKGKGRKRESEKKSAVYMHGTNSES